MTNLRVDLKVNVTIKVPDNYPDDEIHMLTHSILRRWAASQPTVNEQRSDNGLIRMSWYEPQ